MDDKIESIENIREFKLEIRNISATELFDLATVCLICHVD
jgi:hypothetical protein